jgi:hypothetical protein
MTVDGLSEHSVLLGYRVHLVGRSQQIGGEFSRTAVESMRMSPVEHDVPHDLPSQPCQPMMSTRTSVPRFVP